MLLLEHWLTQLEIVSFRFLSDLSLSCMVFLNTMHAYITESIIFIVVFEFSPVNFTLTYSTGSVGLIMQIPYRLLISQFYVLADNLYLILWSCFELNYFFTLSCAGCSTFSLNLETERMIQL